MDWMSNYAFKQTVNVKQESKLFALDISYLNPGKMLLKFKKAESCPVKKIVVFSEKVLAPINMQIVKILIIKRDDQWNQKKLEKRYLSPEVVLIG